MNGISFSSSCLTIGEYCAVVALKAAVGDGLGNVIEYCHLVYCVITNEVKVEDLSISTIVQNDLRPCVLNVNAALIGYISCLSLVERPDSDHNLYVVRVVGILSVLE